MKEFYHKLNKEKDNQRRDDWHQHRLEIHRMIDHMVSTGASREQAIIFGAGNCDDLELDYLSEQFGTVWRLILRNWTNWIFIQNFNIY
jgi:hypothetical protein